MIVMKMKGEREDDDSKLENDAAITKMKERAREDMRAMRIWR